MRKISILIPTYNEVENVRDLSTAISGEMKKLPEYAYEVIFIDNDSTDGTRQRIRELCAEDKRIKAIFNAKNFGQNNSPYYGLTQTTGDCAILMCADFQDPVDMIPVLVREWENGYKIVSAIKTTSRENKVMRFLRTCYYKLIKKFSQVEQIEHFTGFGLYDRAFIEVLRDLKDPAPFLRGIVAELGFQRKEVLYEQQRRRSGTTKNNLYTLYDIAMLSFTSYTKIGLRFATFLGFLISLISIAVAVVYFILKVRHWDTFTVGTAPLLIGMFLLGAIQLIFLGLIGEYILCINTRIMGRPLVIEEERVNFCEEEEKLGGG
ncbi:MAG: glycosyltransferase family 2 protein [Eubacterium sp.]|nr:glycosyltransferase family 2 protein [Eubacterium sp.]